MKLSKDKIIELVEKPANSLYISNGRKYESILRLFTESRLKGELKDEQAWKEFIQFIRVTLGEMKARRIEDYIQYPLSSVGLTKNILKDLYKVFDAGNSFFSVDTVKKDGGDKIKESINNANVQKWIEKVGKEVLKNKPNTVVVIDKDEEGLPYIVEVDSNRLIDFELKQDGFSMEYVIFKHSVIENEKGEEEERISVYDDETYYVLLSDGSGSFTIEKEVAHGVGYCPARMFVDKKLNSWCKFSRDIPLIPAISKLLEYQQLEVYHYYTDLYAAFPIVEMVKPHCGIDSCNNGVLTYEDQIVEDGQARLITKTKACQKCKNDSHIGVGSKVYIPAPVEGQPTASGLFKFISNDVQNLTYLEDKITKLEAFIRNQTVGMDNTIIQQSVNEMQVKGGFQSRENVLLDIKDNLDNLYIWIVRTISNSINNTKEVVVNANFGTEWYLVGEDELQLRYQKGKESGLPESEIREIYFQLIETKYKGNPERLERLKIINMLDPSPYLTNKEKEELKASKGLTISDYILSTRMDSLVKRFEREEGSIVDFGLEIEESKKYERILEILNKYIDEHKQRTDDETIEVVDIGTGA